LCVQSLFDYKPYKYHTNVELFMIVWSITIESESGLRTKTVKSEVDNLRLGLKPDYLVVTIKLAPYSNSKPNIPWNHVHCNGKKAIVV